MDTYELMKAYRILFAPDEGGGAGGSGDAGNGGQGTDSGKGEKPDANDSKAPSGKVFTQDDVNRIAGDTRNEERQKLLRTLKDSGFDGDDINAVLELAKKAKEADDANKTELQKATGALEKAQARITELESELTALRLDQTRNAMAAKYELPAGLVKFLVGSDEATIEASAKELAKEVKKPVKMGDLNADDGTTEGKKKKDGDEPAEDLVAKVRRYTGRIPPTPPTKS